MVANGEHEKISIGRVLVSVSTPLGFDDDGMVSKGSLGGIVDLSNAYVLSENQISFNFDIVYVPHGCKAEDISD